MSQPDRGGLFRIDFSGRVPFEIHTIRVRPRGFTLKFTLPVAVDTARDARSYRIRHYRYEYSSAYGSPERDGRPLAIQGVRLRADGRTVDLDTGRLETGRVYEIAATGVVSQNEV